MTFDLMFSWLDCILYGILNKKCRKKIFVNGFKRYDQIKINYQVKVTKGPHQKKQNEKKNERKTTSDMINALSGILHRDQVLKNGFHLTKSFLNLTCTVDWRARSLKYFSAGIVHYQEDKEQDTFKQERNLPTLIYIQNPITWCINKIDFKMLKSAWDHDFDENEFKRGTKQAVSVICSLISKNMWENLRGLITRQALSRLQRDVQVNWSDEQRRNIDLTPADIKLVLPRKVHFLRIVDQRFVDVDMMFVAMKFREPEPSKNDDLVVIEMVARFHRNYTPQQLPNWTVTLFKITRFDVTPPRK